MNYGCPRQRQNPKPSVKSTMETTIIKILPLYGRGIFNTNIENAH